MFTKYADVSSFVVPIAGKWISMWQTVKYGFSVLNLVKKMEGAKARFTRQIDLKKLSKLAR